MRENHIQLKNGHLIFFLHQHLPFLQARNKVEWNALRRFLYLLDYAITHTESENSITFSLKQEELRAFGTGQYFNTYLETFFLDTRFYFNENKKLKTKTYYTIHYLSDFIRNAQQHLIEKYGLKKYSTPLIFNFDSPLEQEGYSVNFKDSIFLSSSIINSEKMVYSGALNDSVRENHPININENFLESIYESTLIVKKQKDLKDFYKWSQYNSRSAEKEATYFTFKTEPTRRTSEKYSLIGLEGKVYSKIKINTSNLDSLIQEAINENSLSLSSLLTIKHYYGDNDNYIVYEESKQRLYPTIRDNKVNFQGMSKELRSKLFEGFYQYDLEAAAPRILSELYTHISGKILPSVSAYVSNRNDLRYKCRDLLVNEYGTYPDDTLKQVKETLTGLFYGADLSRHGSKLSLEHSKRVFLLESVEELKELTIEVKELFKTVYHYFIETYRDDNLLIFEDERSINLFEEDESPRTEASVLSEIYMYYERRILDIAHRLHPEIILFIHDGFIIEEQIDYAILESLVHEELNLKVSYEEEQV